MGNLHFGYKRHTVTDENGLILAEETSPINESDIKHLETPQKKAKLPWGIPDFADKEVRLNREQEGYQPNEAEKPHHA